MPIEEPEKVRLENTTKSSWMQVFLGFMTNLSNLSLGASLGFSAIALPAMLAVSGPEKITTDQASWIASTASITMPVGCLISGPLLDKYGRKNTLYIVNIISFMGWLFIALASKEPTWQYIMLLLGRLITGVATGLGSIPATVYVSEISSPKLRAVLATWTSVFIAIGVLVVYTLGYYLQENWRMTSMITLGLPIVSFLAIYLFMPESPTWLISQNRRERAEKSLSKIHRIGITSSVLQAEVQQLISHKQQCKDTHTKNNPLGKRLVRKLCYFFTPVCFKPFLIMVTYFFFQQAAGSFVIVFYAVDIVKEAGVAIDPYLAAIYIALARVVAVILLGWVCRQYGRRPPSIISGACMSLAMITLSGYLFSIKLDRIDSQTAKDLNWLPVALIIFYFFMSTLGFLTLPFAMIAEVFPTRVRGFAGGLTTCLAYIFNFIFVKMYPNMIETMGKHGVFGFYGAMSLFGTIFVVLFLPETKGKTLLEIEEYFRGKTEKTDENVDDNQTDGV